MRQPGSRSADTSEQIAVVGSGSVAQALGRLLHDSGQPVVALVARDPQRAQRAAAFVGSDVHVRAYSQVPGSASRVLIAVADDGIADVARALVAAGMNTGIVLHTCGSIGVEALGELRRTGVSCGVLHPMQTVANREQGIESLREITFGIAGDDAAMTWAKEIVRALDGQAIGIPEGGMPIYHAGAVLAGNAIVALLDAAATLLSHAGINHQKAMQAIGPLSRTSLENTLRHGPTAALTGPVSRGDAGTIARHVDTVRDHAPDVMALYLAVTRLLLDVARQQGLAASDARAIEHILDATESGERHEGPDRPNP